MWFLWFFRDFGLFRKGHDVRSIIFHFGKEARRLDENMYSLPMGPLFPELAGVE